LNRPANASINAGILGRIVDCAILASTLGSRSQAMSASIMANDDFDHTSEATVVILIPASWSNFSSRWISRPRSSTGVFR
jgi:hypothetical protein